MYIYTMADFSLILPELLLSIGALILLVIGVFLKKNAYSSIIGLAFSLLIAAIILIVLFSRTGEAFHGALVIDNFSNIIKILILLGTIAVLIMSVDYFKIEQTAHFEFPILCLFSVVGMMIMVSSGNFLSLYLGLELQSLCLYTLAAFHRNNTRSSEAGLKYFVLGSLSSGMLLYGISLLYGFSGTISFHEIAALFSSTEPHIGVIFAIVFIFAGIAFKISAVPFHMWTPDVYEGSPTAVTAFFATAPKIAALTVIVRLIAFLFLPMFHAEGIMPAWQQILIFMAMASIALSAFAGIGQKNIKRLLAYSSIGHIGYILVGLSSGTMAGITSVIVYMIIYLISTIGVFAFTLSLRSREEIKENIYDLSGLFHQNPFLAIAITIQLFSLTAIPPLSGFFAKWYSFLAAIESHLVYLAVFGMVASVIGSFYYLRLIKIIWFDEPKVEFLPLSIELKIILGLSSAFTVCYMFFGKYILSLAQYATLELLS